MKETVTITLQQWEDKDAPEWFVNLYNNWTQRPEEESLFSIRAWINNLDRYDCDASWDPINRSWTFNWPNKESYISFILRYS